MTGWPALIGVIVLMGAVVVYLYGSLFRSISDEKRGNMKLWRNFGLSLGFATLFLLTWIGHGVAQWNKYADEQKQHEQPTEVREFVAEFTTSTLENWQSEFLQLFSFVVMSALLIHRGSAESKDSDERIEMILERIEDKLDDKTSSRS